MFSLRIALLSLLVLCLCASVQADDAQVEAVAPKVHSHVLADVLVDGALVMQVRGTVSFPAARRAEENADNIIATAHDPDIPVDAVTIREEDARTLLLAGDRFLLDLIETDAKIEDLSRELLAQTHQARIREVIADYRSQRSSEVLLTKSSYALASILGAALLILGFWWVFRRIADLLDRRPPAQLKQLEAKSARLIRSRSLIKLLRGLTKLVFVALVLVALYASIHYVLGLFPWTHGFAVWLFGLILNPLPEIGLGFLATLPSLGWLVVLLLIAKYLFGIIHAFFRGVASGDLKLASLDRDLAWPTHRIIRLVVIICALVMAYPHIPGSDAATFKGLSVLLGLIVALDSQSIIGIMIAGMFACSRPVGLELGLAESGLRWG